MPMYNKECVAFLDKLRTITLPEEFMALPNTTQVVYCRNDSSNSPQGLALWVGHRTADCGNLVARFRRIAKDDFYKIVRKPPYKQTISDYINNENAGGADTLDDIMEFLASRQNYIKVLEDDYKGMFI
jgi:hypothetical protein